MRLRGLNDVLFLQVLKRRQRPEITFLSFLFEVRASSLPDVMTGKQPTPNIFQHRLYLIHSVHQDESLSTLGLRTIKIQESVPLLRVHVDIFLSHVLGQLRERFNTAKSVLAFIWLLPCCGTCESICFIRDVFKETGIYLMVASRGSRISSSSSGSSVGLGKGT